MKKTEPETKESKREARLNEIEEYIKYVVAMLKVKGLKQGVPPSVYIEDVEFLLEQLRLLPPEKPIEKLLGPAPLIDVDALVAKAMTEKQ